MAQFFDVNSTPAGTAIKTLLDLSQLQRQDATTKNLESDSRMREMQTASLGQNMAAQQQLMQRQMEFRNVMAASMQQDKATTDQPTTSVSADQQASANDPNVQMAKQLQQWQAQRTQYAKLEQMGMQTGGMDPQQAIDLRTRINELDGNIRKSTEDMAKAKAQKMTAVGNVLAGVDSAPALDAALNHMDTTFPGSGTQLRAKLPTDTDGNLVWNDATKAVINPFIDQTTGASVRVRQEMLQAKVEQSAADNQRKDALAASLESWRQAKAAALQAGSETAAQKAQLQIEKLQAQVDLYKTNADKPPVDPLAKIREEKADAAAGPANDRQLGMAKAIVMADPDNADRKFDGSQAALVADVANKANLFRAAAIKRGDGSTYGYDQALTDAYNGLKPFVTDSAKTSGGFLGIGGDKMRTYTRAAGIKGAADQQAKDNAERAATPIFASPDEVKAALDKGILTKDAAVKILKSKFGYSD